MKTELRNAMATTAAMHYLATIAPNARPEPTATERKSDAMGYGLRVAALYPAEVAAQLRLLAAAPQSEWPSVHFTRSGFLTLAAELEG